MVTNRDVNNVIRISCGLKTNFFRALVEFLTPIHKLCNREKDVLAALLKTRFELSKEISDEILLDKVTLSNETKERIQKEAGVSSSFYQVIISKLRRAGIITKDRIHPKLIPKYLKSADDCFQLLLYFDFDTSGNNTKRSSKRAQSS